MRPFGQQSEVGVLRDVLVADPVQLYGNDSKIADEWRRLNFTAKPDRERLLEEFESFVSSLEMEGVNVDRVIPSDELSLDAIYIRDSSLVLPDGTVVVCRMGKATRRGESSFIQNYYGRLGIRVAGVIEPPGMLEGGDVIMLDSSTLLIGRSYRTNGAGIEQLRKIIPESIEHVVSVPLPHFRGPEDVLHLMSSVSPLDEQTLLVHLKLLPIEFIEWLLERNYTLIEIADDEYDSLACNVLSLGGRRCLMVKGTPTTASRLRAASFAVIEIDGADLCRKGCGGPTCLTRPLYRE